VARRRPLHPRSGRSPTLSGWGFNATLSTGSNGLAVDAEGRVYVSAPGGVWILSPEGRHLGTIRVDERPANFAWGDTDGRTLYMTAHTGLYRIRLAVSGTRPPLVARAR
jgi:sugar lactone lactonase YvrE